MHYRRSTSSININPGSWYSNTSGQVLTSMPLTQGESITVSRAVDLPAKTLQWSLSWMQTRKGWKAIVGAPWNAAGQCGKQDPFLRLLLCTQLSPPAAIVRDDTWALDKKTSILFIPPHQLHQTLKWTNHATSLQTEHYTILKQWYLQLPYTGHFYAGVSKSREVGQAFQVPEAIHLSTWEA